MVSFEDQIVGALKALMDAPPVEIELSALEAWIVVSQLQLALRHPRNLGHPAAIAHAVARKIQALAVPDGVLAQLAEMGWHSECDDYEGTNS